MIIEVLRVLGHKKFGLTGQKSLVGLKCSRVCDLAEVAGAPELQSSVSLTLDLTLLAANPPQGHINSFNLEPPQYAPS